MYYICYCYMYAIAIAKMRFNILRFLFQAIELHRDDEALLGRQVSSEPPR